MSARDAARLLGLSHQRVHQLAQGDAERQSKVKRGRVDYLVPNSRQAETLQHARQPGSERESTRAERAASRIWSSAERPSSRTRTARAGSRCRPPYLPRLRIQISLGDLSASVQQLFTIVRNLRVFQKESRLGEIGHLDRIRPLPFLPGPRHSIHILVVLLKVDPASRRREERMVILTWRRGNYARLAAIHRDGVNIDITGVLARGLINDPLSVRTRSGHGHHVRLRRDLPRAGGREVVQEDFVLEILVDDSGTIRQPSREIGAVENLPRIRAVRIDQPQALGIRSLCGLSGECDRPAIRRPLRKRLLEPWIRGELDRLRADIDAPDVPPRAARTLEGDRADRPARCDGSSSPDCPR